MPNITISGLPPAILPLDDPNTLFEVTVLEAGEEVSRKITLSDIAASTGLDASFLTLSANAQLPNERVLTEGTNVTFVDSGPNGTLTINVAGFAVSFPLLAPDGSAVAPSYSFTNDPGAGMFLNALGELSLAADGVEIARAINGATDQFAVVPGSGSLPGLTSLTDLDTGFVWTGSNQTVWMGGGSEAWNFTTGRFFSEFSQGPSLENTTAQDDVPTVLPDQSDSNTGLGSAGSDAMTFVAGGLEVARAIESGGDVSLILDPNRTATEAAPALAFGDGDTGFRQPLDDNLQVILAGSTRFFWELDSFNSLIGTGPAMRNEASSATNPVFTPNRGDQDTGIGQNAVNEVSLIGGGVELARAVAAASGGLLANNTLTGAGIERVLTISDAFAGVPDPLLLSDGSAAAPSYSFASDTDIGMFRVGADILGLAARATLIAQAVGALGANQFVVAPGAVQNNVSAPDLGLGDGDTGVMQTVDDTIALVAGANLAVRYAEASGSVIQTNSSDVALTASVTQTQAGGLALLDSYNEISTVGTTGDALTAFDVFQGTRLVVVNNGANDLQLFPAVGDDFGAGVDTAITIVAGELGIFLGRDSVNWDTLYNAAAIPGGPGGVLPVGTVSEASLKWNGVDAWIEEIQIRLTGGSTGITILDAGGTDNIRIGHDGSNALVRTTGSAEVIFGGGGAGPTTAWRYEQMVRVPDGSAAVPGITWFGDIATGIFRQALGLSISITGVEQARFSNATTQIFSDDFRLVPNIGADSVIMRVDPPADPDDFTITLASLVDFHIIGAGLERFVLEELNLAMVEKAAAPGDVAGVGQFWVRNDVPNIPMYTDDTGIDFKLGVANDAVQARRTTSYVLTTAFADVTLDTTDIETDDQIIEHSGTTDQIEAQVAGTYEVTYGTDIDPAAAGNDNIRAFGRVRLNDAGVDLPGSLASATAYNDASTIGNNVFGRLQCSFIVVLAAGDFLTLQLQKVETGGTGIFTAEEVTVTVKRLL